MVDNNEFAVLEEFTRVTDLLFAEGQFTQVVEEASRLLSLNPKGVNNRSYAAARFIDCASNLSDLTLVERGIELLEELLKENSLNKDVEIAVKYNLSNGYTTKADLLYKTKEISEAQAARRVSQAIAQNLLIEKRFIEQKQLASILVNYANSLDQSGRSIEAIDHYFDALDIYSHHPNALGNCGVAICHLHRIPQPHVLQNISVAIRLLDLAIAQESELIQIAGPQSVSTFRNYSSTLKKWLEDVLENGLDTFREFESHRKEVHSKPEAPEWLRQINQDRLLLSINLQPLNSIDECKDDLYFQSVVTEIEEGDKRLNNLIHIFNTLKEDFVTARFLFYLPSSSDMPAVEDISSITDYGDALDYADYGLSTGLKKSCLRLAVGCLDKIAIFLNAYFDLGHDVSSVNFNNIWFDKLASKKQQINPILEAKSITNIYLQALRELQQDLFLQQYPGPLLEARRSATHRTLPLYWMKPFTKTDDFAWDIDSFTEAIFLLLRMIKAAITYLVCLVALEEHQRDDKGIIPTLFFKIGTGITDELTLSRKSDERGKSEH